MTKGTASHGKMNKQKTHITCRRCGRHTFHKSKKVCASCGFGGSPRMRHYTFYKRKDMS
jgi:large subunit ribosomal protein L37e